MFAKPADNQLGDCTINGEHFDQPITETNLLSKPRSIALSVRLRAALEAVREGTAMWFGKVGKITVTTHAALLCPEWRSLGPLVMALEICAMK